MFISQVEKKDFKKPNILRKNNKVSLCSPHHQIIKLVSSCSSQQTNNHSNLEYVMDNNIFYNLHTDHSGESSQSLYEENLQRVREYKSSYEKDKEGPTFDGLNTSQCDVPDCIKQFKTEEKLAKHKNGHRKEKKIIKRTSFQCPAQSAETQNYMCAIEFCNKDELLEHLKNDHTLQDAAHECGECGRRFFARAAWRAHARAHVADTGAARPALRCAWPGCQREFRQPCRLREHARAHTGDRPYPCLYPECGWSFRSASKLVRHARRHTGERRHACDECSRAFRRREHLREHKSRTHRHNGHPDNVENVDDPAPSNKTSDLDVAKRAQTRFAKREKNFVISMCEPSLESVEAGEDARRIRCDVYRGDRGAEDRAARTHCPWPQPRARHVAPEPEPPAIVEEVECSDNSNIYTIYSDLFLHENILMNEESQNIDSSIPDVDSDTGMVLLSEPALDLGLVDTHPTIDLMQEELLYTDVTVDESSFRIFMLNGGELD